MFISKDYADKAWTTHERRSAQARAFEENSEYILPARFDDTEIPGVLSTVGYIGLKDKSPEAFCEVVVRKLVLSGLTVPSEQVRKDLYETKRLASIEPTNLTVSVQTTQGIPIHGASLLAVADNGTSISATTDETGKAQINIKTRRLYSVLVAHEHFPCAIYENVDPGQNIDFKLSASANIGSIIIVSTGYIPGLSGRLNPIVDTLGRSYLYAGNISINNGSAQPATFSIGTLINLEDSNGNITDIAFKFAFRDNFLIQYTRPD